MIRPFKGTIPVTQEWGNDLVINGVHIYAQWGYKGHNGVDYGTPTGTPIIAPHGGKVIEAGFDQYGYGMYVKIENDVEGSILAHLKSFVVNAGDIITEGTEIGISDNTGNSTGPHLHWGYFRKPRNKADGYSGTTNPYLYLTENIPAPTPPAIDYKKLYEESQQKVGDLQATEARLKLEITNKDKSITERDTKITTLTSKLGQIKALCP